MAYTTPWDGAEPTLTRAMVAQSLDAYIVAYFRDNGVDPQRHIAAARDYVAWSLSDTFSPENAIKRVQEYLERQVRIAKDAL